MTAIKLPTASGGIETFSFSGAGVTPDRGPWNRKVFAAAHVVVDPLADNNPWSDCNVDWEKTMVTRKRDLLREARLEQQSTGAFHRSRQGRSS